MKLRLVNCPHCGQPSPYDSSNPFRPFCCERCRLIDLGQWASESYRVPLNEGPGPDDVPSEPDQ
ncbi:MAG: DNA gyrase inhibitor YacG [Pseudomonadota bacterium]